MRTHPLRVAIIAPRFWRAREYALRCGLRPGFWSHVREARQLRGQRDGTLYLFLVYDWPESTEVAEIRCLLEMARAPVIEISRDAEGVD